MKPNSIKKATQTKSQQWSNRRTNRQINKQNTPGSKQNDFYDTNEFFGQDTFIKPREQTDSIICHIRQTGKAYSQTNRDIIANNTTDRQRYIPLINPKLAVFQITVSPPSWSLLPEWGLISVAMHSAYSQSRGGCGRCTRPRSMCDKGFHITMINYRNKYLQSP